MTPITIPPHRHCEEMEARETNSLLVVRWELSTTLKNLGSSASQWDNVADTLEGTSMVTNNDLREMVPFNLLRNSRADDGLAYWVSSGFEADGENGAS